MENEELRDTITVEDENGVIRDYRIEALFDMEEDSYALLRDGEETLLMRIEDEDEEQYLVGIEDLQEKNSILDAYQIAVEAAPAD
ncbi:DUF1292 domain-containing protein [Bacillus sp. PS06]|uniref:DUF1292 domain-containing protein n=1 Tax=Bacillus sp. PS06 TaxID=2764176 RepID=UPI001784802C|nr:DUF1292 domain-containing protein [Bacillus sp. PS06]MBD8071050.1 DUF1292 domain-containing protein [Bacillus sp. PS06]